MGKGGGADGVAVTGESSGLTASAVPARPPLHLGLYGEPHCGKSHFAATFVGALAAGQAVYVAFFDRRGKHLTYEKVWRKLLGPFTIKAGVDKRQTPYMDYLSAGKRFARIAHYATPIVEETDGASRFQSYMPTLESEIAAGKWGVVVVDSVSFMALDARKESEYVTNPASKSGNKQHGMVAYAHSTDVVEEVLCCQLPNLDCNTVAIMHESKVLVEAEGGMVRSPAVPGKRLASTNMIAATFPELYRLYVERAEDGKKVRRLQTDSDERFQAGSVIGVPDGAKPDYSKLWASWDAGQA